MLLTRTTDWGDSHYISILKYKIKELCPKVSILDISHSLPPFNERRKYLAIGYIIASSYKTFPLGSLHFIGFESESVERLLLIEYDGHYFLGAKSSFDIIFLDAYPEKIKEMPQRDLPFSSLLDLKEAIEYIDSLSPVNLLSLIKEKDLDRKDESIYSFKGASLPVINDSGSIVATVIYVDLWGNLVLNITKSYFDKKICKTDVIEIVCKTPLYSTDTISKSFEKSDRKNLTAFFNSFGYLMLSTFGNNLAQQVVANVGDQILIKLKKKSNKYRDFSISTLDL